LKIFNKSFCLPLLALLLIAKTNADETAQENQKPFYFLEFNLATINGLGGSFL
jgi:hypothetical protein